MKYTKNQLCLIWLDSFVGLEYKRKFELYNSIKESNGIKEFLSTNRAQVESLIGANEFSTLLASANAEYLDYIVKGLSAHGVIAVTLDSEDYPHSLTQLECPPLVLYAKGDVNLLNAERTFGIVGSRRSLPLQISLARSYTKALTDNGFVTVTGIAEGVDSAVLEETLKNDGKSISVIAGGFDNIYPKSNVNLLESVIDAGGLAIAEYPPQTVPKPFHFPVRNRIISALSNGVLIVSAGAKSGTFYTAEYASELSKEVFVIPYSVGISSGVGCNELIKKGGILTDTPKDILEFYGIEEKSDTEVELSDLEKEIIIALSDGEMHIENLARTIGKGVEIITPILSVLEIKGVIVRSGNVYLLCKKDLEV